MTTNNLNLLSVEEECLGMELNFSGGTVERKTCLFGSSGVVVRSTGAYKRLAVIRQGQYLDGWPELSTLFLNTTPARLFGLDSENRSHGSPSSFG